MPDSIAQNHVFSRLGALAADGLTLLRAGVALVIVGLGMVQGADALAVVVYLATLGWVADWVDGPLARAAGRPTRLGRFDFAIDVGLTWACLAYTALSGYAPPVAVAGYTLAAAGAVLYWRRRVVLMLFMRGVDVFLVLIVLRYAPATLVPFTLALAGFGLARRRRVQRQISRALMELRQMAGMGNDPSSEDI